MAARCLKNIPKQVEETILVWVDFTRDLAEGESVSDQEVTSRLEKDGTDTSADMIETPSHTGNIVYARLKENAGQAGRNEIVQMKAITSQGNKLIGNLRIIVWNP